MAKDSDKRRRGFDAEETGGGALSGLLAEEDEFDRRTLWRLGTWAAVSVAAVVVALVTNQSAIGLRRDRTASADLVKQAQQLQLSMRESRSETHRLASAIDTLNSDRDRLYSKVAVIEQGLDSVTGTIARQPSSSPQANAGPANSAQAASGQVGASTSPPAGSPASSPVSASAPSPAPGQSASLASATATSTTSTANAPTPSASVDPPAAAAKSSPPAPAVTAPAVAPVAATAPAIPDKTAAEKPVAEKQAKLAVLAIPPPEPSAPAKPAGTQQDAAAQPSGALMASKSMIGPPDPAAGKLIEPDPPSKPATPPKTVTSAPLPEIAAVAPKEKAEEADSAPPELVARHTEFGVDVGGANSVPGLRALWRGLLRSRGNAALTTLRPIIVIKENNNGLGMQLRLVAGPINDAAAAAKICASLTVSDRSCTTTVFEGQRLTMSADEQPKLEARTSSASKPASETKPVPEAKPDSDSKSGSGYHRRYIQRHAAPKEEVPPKPEPSTLSRIFGSS